MKKVPLTIKGLSYSERQTGAYALVLAEENGERKLPIVIGGFEAQAIAIALEKMVSPPRPLTHDLFKHFAASFEIEVREIIIYKIKDGVFYSNIIATKDGEDHVIDARPSDAVALAIRFGCPMYTTEEVLQSAGLILQEEGSTPEPTSETPQTDTSSSNNPMSEASMDELHEMLNKAVNQEDYELAARIRDEIDRRAK